MTNTIERKKALEATLQQKMKELQQIEAMRNSITVEIIQIRGKIELLEELLKDEKE